MTSGGVVWFTGLPSSGKSTLAHRVADELRARGIAHLVLDGDEVRAALRPEPGYDDDARSAFYETLARLAALAARQGLVVLVPATANRAIYRARARELAPRWLLVLVDTPLEEARRRDAKGLYARAARDGDTSTLPGVGMVYERPTDADLVIAPDDHGAPVTVAESVRRRFEPDADR